MVSRSIGTLEIHAGTTDNEILAKLAGMKQLFELSEILKKTPGFERHTMSLVDHGSKEKLGFLTLMYERLDDMCPRCSVPGRFTARAALCCPRCNMHIGGLA